MTEVEISVQADQIAQVFEGECPSVSGRSTLTYAIGRHSQDESLHLRIVRNSGGGMSCTDWASSEQIEKVVKGSLELTAKSFSVLHPGKSINTGGFVLAVLKDLGYIRANVDNTRLHERVPTTTIAQLAMDRIGGVATEVSGKAGRRKAKEA